MKGTRTQIKRGDRGRRRTVGRIKRGGGDGGEPARSPPGWLEFSPAAWPLRLCYETGVPTSGQVGTPELLPAIGTLMPCPLSMRSKVRQSEAVIGQLSSAAQSAKLR